MKTVNILGSTGPIGTSTLDVIRHQPGHFRVGALSTHTRIDLVLEQAAEFGAKKIVVSNREKYEEIKKKNIPVNCEIIFGTEGLIETATDKQADIIVSSLVGAAGLAPTIAAIKSGKKIALANKEVLVIAGEYIMKNHSRELKENITPVDSEHSAIFQCLQGEKKASLEKILLTASGGPFIHKPVEEFPKITPMQALKHPNWSMGNKITIDSATMMNKGLEVIEARWLFDVKQDKIEILIHPESIIHSMIQFCDGSIMGQMNVPDMRLAIQYALSYPERLKNPFPRVNFPDMKSFHFFEPDKKKFRLINTAYKALEKGNIYPAAMNAANEMAVDFFLNKKITFDNIPDLVDDIMLSFEAVEELTIDEILKADKLARVEAQKWIQNH